MGKLDIEMLLKEVRAKGVEIDTYMDLMKIDMKYRDLVPILLRYLKDTTPENEKEFLVRCLGVKGFTEASQPLIDEFYKARNGSLKFAIGNSLSIISDKNSLPKMIKIAQEKEHGTERIMIVHGLGKYKSEEAKAVLISLLNDEDVAGHAIYALGKTRDKTLIKYIEPFLTHKVAWIRNEAKKVIKKLEKA
jgi:HEAT repeat protein